MPSSSLVAAVPGLSAGVGATVLGRPLFGLAYILVQPLTCGAATLFVIAAQLGSLAQLSACAAGGYFFRFAGKSNQKGATSL
ncbi:MAG: hypothetical protein LBO63_03055 [Oscillospiraceae bacterium]|jgi:hypothetical protein|nr:hypothetical protein [Oscillospiraceae bacterium]